jgi:inhibitor of cysteine peptidase
MTLISRIFSLVGLVAGSFAFTVAHADTIRISEAEHGSQVTLNVGDTLLVTLNANLSTGYSWNIAQNNGSLLRPSGKPSYQQADSGLMGASGTQTFKFKAVGSGGEGLVMLYQKNSLKGVQAADTFQILVVINRPNQGKTVTVTDQNNNGHVVLNQGDTLIVQTGSKASAIGFVSDGSFAKSAVRSPGGTTSRSCSRAGSKGRSIGSTCSPPRTLPAGS